MMKLLTAIFWSSSFLLFSCAGTRNNYVPGRKFSKQSLQQDYRLLQNILEKKHPSLYWYTPKDSMDEYFTRYYNTITDSMTEQQFAWQVLAPLTANIHCGHTSVSMRKSYSKWLGNKRFPSFPLFMKVWNDTMAVTGSLRRNDSIFKRGTLITSVNGLRNAQLIQKMFRYLPEDGYADNINYLRLSANFPYYHRNIFGLSKNYTVGYMDSSGTERTAILPLFIPVKDSSKRDSLLKPPKQKIPKEQKLLQYRSLEIDSSGTMAIMTLNTFSKGKLRRFFRRSFRKLKEQQINNLVLDIRSNGGGRVGLSTLLTRYLSRQPFKVADTLYAVAHGLGPYTRYVKGKFLNNLEMLFISRKNKDGLYHVHHLEHKLYKPKQNGHYDGEVYVLINGPTFSASALFCNAVKGQRGITLMGEETGGGWYGNSGIMIPDITLPNTRLRVRLPLFRLVQYNHIAQKGTGVKPDIYVGPNYEALLNGYDKKMQQVKQLIRDRIQKKLP